MFPIQAATNQEENTQSVERLRFAFLSQAWPDDENAVIAGSSVQVYYVANELARRGYPVLVILSSHPNFRDFNSGNLSVISIFQGTALRHNLSSTWQRAVKRKLNEFKPDVIYQRGKLPESIAAAAAGQKMNACFLWLSNSDKTPETWKFVRKRWAKRYDVSKFLPRIMEAIYADIFIERSIKRADVVVCQTRSQKDQFISSVGMQPHVLGSGHPIPAYYHKSSSIPSVLWLANLTEIKQPLLFAKLARALKSESGHFIMAGKAPDRKLLQQVKTITYDVQRFNYHGGVGLREGDSLFKQAALFVSTSQYEGIPNTFIQACKHGTPIISLNNDPDNIIQSEQIGEVVDSFEALVECVRRWLHDDELRTAAGKRAYEFAKREFDISKIVDRLLEIVQSFIAEKGNS